MQGITIKDRLQTGCVLRSKLRPHGAPHHPHQLYWHRIIPLKLKLSDEQGAYLQMGNQFNLDIGSHWKLLNSDTGAALEPGVSASASSVPRWIQVDDETHAATYWLGILKKGLIHCIHGGKVGHIRQKDAHPDHVLHA